MPLQHFRVKNRCQCADFIEVMLSLSSLSKWEQVDGLWVVTFQVHGHGGVCFCLGSDTLSMSASVFVFVSLSA